MEFPKIEPLTSYNSHCLVSNTTKHTFQKPILGPPTTTLFKVHHRMRNERIGRVTKLVTLGQ